MITALAVISFGLVGGAATQVASAQSLFDVGDEVDQTGRYVEKDVDAELEAAIERANDANIGFVWLDQDGEDAQQIAGTISDYLQDVGSDYRSIVVLNNDSVWVSSRGANGTAAGENARELFAIGDEAGGLDLVTDTITGAVTDSNSGTDSSSDSSTGADSSAPTTTAPNSGSSFPWIIPILVVGLAFLAFRFFSGKRRKAKKIKTDMEADRLEIREQLRDNADRVIDLGDRVIGSGDPEMIRTYEKASATYQDVSQSIDAASTPEEVDRLDDRIDEAEWQFEVIEAKLDGRPAPDSPADLAPPPPPGAGDRVNPPVADERPTVTRRGRTVPPLGGPRGVPAPPRQQPHQQQPQQQGRGRGRRNSIGGGMAGGLGRVLMSGMGRMVLSAVVSMLLGGAGSRGGSRRTQRRSSGRSGGGISGPGGGVLRRGR